MLSFNELHIDFLRLLNATERLVANGEPSADGSWENWSRFCQFISSLDGLQSQLLARISETHARSTPTASNPQANPTLHPSAEDLDRYDRRLETLRRKREDLSSAAAAATAEAEAAAAAAPTDDTDPDAGVTPTAAEVGVTFAAAEILPREEQFNRTEGGVAYGVTFREKSQRHDAGRGLFGPRDSSKRVLSGRRAWGGGGGGGIGETHGDEAEADHVAQEISSMAGRLKESSIAINKTLRAQTQVLEDTGDVATLNADRVKRETERVGERLRKKRAAMCASWCMMVVVVATFLATYVLIILPFDKRRGPFVRPRNKSFADAAKQSPNISTQQLQRFAYQNATDREQAIIESVVEYREWSGRARAEKMEESDSDESSLEEHEEEILQSTKAESTSQDAFDDSSRAAEEPELENEVILEPGDDSAGQANPLVAKISEVEGVREPVCADPEGAKSCVAVAESEAVEAGHGTAEPDQEGVEDIGETKEGKEKAVEDIGETKEGKEQAVEDIGKTKEGKEQAVEGIGETKEGKEQVVQAAELMKEEKEKTNMKAFEERGEELGSTVMEGEEREVTLQLDAETSKRGGGEETQEEGGVERSPGVDALLSGEGGVDDIVKDGSHPRTRARSGAQYQDMEIEPAVESARSVSSTSEKRDVETAESVLMEDRGVSADNGSGTGRDNSLEAVRQRLRDSLGKRKEGENSGQGGSRDEL